MTLELNPVGVKCNLACTYCYENPMRTIKQREGYNIDLMLSKVNSDFVLFGGEPLLLPFADLEKFLQYGYEKFKKNGIQTNGTLITERHIELFKRTNTSVGISIDGPGELNDARKLAASIEGTRKATSKTIENIYRLFEAEISVSLIVTIHRLNAIGESREKLKGFLRDLHARGIQGIRLHPLENDGADELVLTEEENIEAYLDLQTLPIKFDIFFDIQKLLTEEGASVTCTWNGCDPYTTPAVQGIDGDGSSSNCGRVNKTGVSFRKSDKHGNERIQVLYNTPQEFGGCKGCEYFYACKGQCPGEGINGDWRNRSSNCGLYKSLFKAEESRLLREGKSVITLERRRIIEKKLLDNSIGRTYNGAGNWHKDTHEDWYFFQVEVR